MRGVFVSILCSETNLTMDDKKAAIIKILEMAIIEEIKAKNFYFKMSAQLSNNEAQSRFRHMAEAEQEHEDIVPKLISFLLLYVFLCVLCVSAVNYLLWTTKKLQL